MKLPNWRPYLPHALGGLSLIFLIGFGMQTCQTRSVQRALVQARQEARAAILHDDSVRTAIAAKDEEIGALRANAAAADSIATSWRRRAQTVERTLAQLALTRNQLRDSLTQITTGADSLPVLVRLVSTLSSENLTLRTGLTDALRADSARKQAVDSLTAGLDSSTARYELVFASNKQLRAALEQAQKALARAEPPCRILFLRCPSRTAIAVTSAGIGAGLTFYLTAR